MATPRERVVAVALSQVGVSEQPAGSNRTRYGAAYGMNGQPWCAMFVWWVYREALGVDLRGLLGQGMAYTPVMTATARAKGWTVPVESTRPGDIVQFDFPGGDATDHTGVAIGRADIGHSTLPTVEGNTSVAGSQSNGGAVCRKDRPFRQVRAVIRVPVLDAGQPPPAPPPAPGPATRPVPSEENRPMFLCKGDATDQVWLTDMLTKTEVTSTDQLQTYQFLLTVAGKKADIAPLRQAVVDAIPRNPTDGDWLRFAAGVITGTVEKITPGASAGVDVPAVARQVADELSRRLAQ